MRKVLWTSMVLFFSLLLCAYAQEGQTKTEKNASLVTLYLKSGEIIKGKPVHKDSEAFTIEKSGNTFSLKMNEILRVEEEGVGKGLWGRYFFPFSTAVVHYELKGMETGQEVAYIDVPNNRVAIETMAVAHYGSDNHKVHMMKIYDGKIFRTINLEDRHGVSMKQEESDMMMGTFGEKLYFGYPVRQGTILGKECNVYSQGGNTAAFWCGLLFKQELTGGQPPSVNAFYSSQEATDIKIDVPISPEKFNVPAGIEMQSMEDLAGKMKEEREKYSREMQEWRKKEFLALAETDPSVKKILKDSTGKDGRMDVDAVEKILQKKREKELLDKVKGMKGGAELIQKATRQDGSMDTVQLSGLMFEQEQGNYQLQASESYKKYLLEQAVHSPEIKKIIDQSTGEGGAFDMRKAEALMQEQSKKELLEKVKKLKDGKALIREATGASGEIDIDKLNSLVREKEKELRVKAGNFIEAGRIFQEQKKYPEALKKFTEAIDLGLPDVSFAYQLRSSLYELMGNNEKAIQDLSEVIKNERFLSPYTYVERGDLYARSEKYQEAIADYSKAIAMEIENAKRATEQKKEALQKVGENTAKIDFETLGYDLRALVKRGKLYRKIGQNEPAIADFTKIIETNKSDKSSLKDAYFFRGLTYKQMNEAGKMKEDLAKAESLGSKLVEGEYVQGVKQGTFIWYHANGNMATKGNYVDDQLEGDYHTYHPNGQASVKGTYKAGKVEGLYTWYDSNGKKKEEGHFKAGKKDGIFSEFDPHGGMTSKLNYVNDELEGEGVPLFWSNGTPVEKAIFKNGVRDGMEYKYYENGQMQQAVPFKNGLENGTATLYKQDGSFKKKVVFKNGQRMQVSYKP